MLFPVSDSIIEEINKEFNRKLLRDFLLTIDGISDVSNDDLTKLYDTYTSTRVNSDLEESEVTLYRKIELLVLEKKKILDSKCLLKMLLSTFSIFKQLAPSTFDGIFKYCISILKNYLTLDGNYKQSNRDYYGVISDTLLDTNQTSNQQLYYQYVKQQNQQNIIADLDTNNNSIIDIVVLSAIMKGIDTIDNKDSLIASEENIPYPPVKAIEPPTENIPSTSLEKQLIICHQFECEYGAQK